MVFAKKVPLKYHRNLVQYHHMKIFSFADVDHKEAFPFFIQHATVGAGTFDMHGHHFSELVVVLSGSGQHVTEAESYPICRGDVFVLNGQTAHAFEDSSRLKLCNVMYDPDQLIRPHQNLHAVSGYQALFVLEPLYRKNYSFKSKLQLGEADLNTVVMLLDALEREQKARLQGYQSLLAAYFMQLVVLLSRYYSASPARPTQAILRLADVLSYLENNTHRPLELTELAGRANLSKNQFLRVFKKAFDTTPITYIVNRRIQKAQKLLETTSLPVSQIAFDTGFMDSNYFSRRFRQVVGQSPRDYRATLGDNGLSYKLVHQPGSKRR